MDRNESDVMSIEGQPRPGNRILGDGSMHHVAIWSADVDRSLAFYQQGLGFTEMFRCLDPGLTIFLGSGQGVGVELFENPHFAPRLTPDDLLPLTNHPARMGEVMTARGVHWHFCVRTTEVDEATENACRFGGRVVIPPMDDTLKSIAGQGNVPVRFSFIEGPNGEWIELLQVGAIPPQA